MMPASPREQCARRGDYRAGIEDARRIEGLLDLLHEAKLGRVGDFGKGRWAQPADAVLRGDASAEVAGEGIDRSAHRGSLRRESIIVGQGHIYVNIAVP